MACTIGQQLRQARLGKGLSIEDVAHATKIAVSALEAMESDDLSIFANATYRRSFLRLYSRYLGVDESDVLAALNQTKKGRRVRADFLQTDLNLHPTDHTIPLVKHQIIERKPKRSALGFALFLLLTLMLPAVYYAGKWVGLREGITKVKELDVPVQTLNQVPRKQTGEPIRAQVIAPHPRGRYGDQSTRVYPADSEMNKLLGLDAPAPSRKAP